MASIIPIGDKYRAQVRRAGQPTLTKTFTGKTQADAKRLAEAWAIEQENAINAGKKVGIHGKTGMSVAQAIDRYIEEAKHVGTTGSNIFGYLKIGLGKIQLEKLTDDDIVGYIKKKKFGPMSGAMHFSFLSSVLKMAKVGWKYHVPEVLDVARDRLKILGLIGTSKERDRRPSPEEIVSLLKHKYPTPIPMADIIEFAITTAMRQAEITRIDYKTLDEDHKTVVIVDRKHPKKKSGNNQIVPLLDSALEIIKRQARSDVDSRIFPYNPTTIGTYFTKACKDLGIDDLHFHDLRHEGASRLFEMGYQIHEVAKFTGHEDWKMLQRYTHLKAKDIRRLESVKQEQVKVEGEGFAMDAATLEQFKMFQAMQAMMKQQQDKPAL